MIMLIKLGIVKITPHRIKKWAKTKKLFLLKYAAKNSDFRSRREVAKQLAHFTYTEIKSTLLFLLHDKVFSVAENAIDSFSNFQISKEIEDEIQTVLKNWKQSEAKMKENWSNLDSSFHGLYIDKSNMIRLKELKYWMSKQKGSMSIG